MLFPAGTKEMRPAPDNIIKGARQGVSSTQARFTQPSAVNGKDPNHAGIDDQLLQEGTDVGVHRLQ
jgi:hypothetical protein